MPTTTSSVFGDNPEPTPSQDTPTPAPPAQDETQSPVSDQVNMTRARAQNTQDRLEQAEEELERLDKENQELHDLVKQIVEPMIRSHPKHNKGKEWKEIISGWAEWYRQVENTINWDVSSPETADQLDKSYGQYLKLSLIKAIVDSEENETIDDTFRKWRSPGSGMPFEEPDEQR